MPICVDTLIHRCSVQTPCGAPILGRFAAEGHVIWECKGLVFHHCPYCGERLPTAASNEFPWPGQRAELGG